MTDQPKDVGDLLLARGCRQGMLVDAPARIAWLRGGAASWEVADEELKGTKLVVASQDCDIKARETAEPFVEMLVVIATNDRNQIHSAKKGNSARRFLLRVDGGGAALIADGRRRALVEKQSLLTAEFSPVFAPEDRDTGRRFAEWLGGRYMRSAISEAYVTAVHKPVVRAVEKADEPTKRRLDAVDEVLFRAVQRDGLLEVDLVVLTDGQELDPEDEAELAGWLEGVLAESCLVSQTRIAFRTPATISLHAYTELTRLELDYFSAE